MHKNKFYLQQYYIYSLFYKLTMQIPLYPRFCYLTDY